MKRINEDYNHFTLFWLQLISISILHFILPSVPAILSTLIIVNGADKIGRKMLFIIPVFGYFLYNLRNSTELYTSFHSRYPRFCVIFCYFSCIFSFPFKNQNCCFSDKSLNHGETGKKLELKCRGPFFCSPLTRSVH